MSDPLSQLTQGLFSISALSVATQGLLQEQHLHPRSQIRTAAVEALKGQVAAGDRVFPSLVQPIPDHMLPALFVYTGDDPVEKVDVSPRRLWRKLELVVHTITALPGDLDGIVDTQLQLDEIERLVELILGTDKKLQSLCESIILSRTVVGNQANGSQTVTFAATLFDVTYLTDVVDLVGDDFRSFGVQWDTAEPDGQIEAEDEIALEQEES